MGPIYSLLADLVLILHFAFVAFVIVGLVLVGIGGWCGWGFVRNVWFRAAHLLAIATVAGESLAGVICPLTTWENDLRLLAGGGERYQGSFVQHWLHRVMFYNASEDTFTILYVLFFGAVLLSFWLVAPRWPGRPSSRAEKKSAE